MKNKQSQYYTQPNLVKLAPTDSKRSSKNNTAKFNNEYNDAS